MASLKPVIRINQIKIDGKCNIKIRICHKRRGDRSKVTYFATPYNIEPKFMLKSGHIALKYPSQSFLTTQLNLLLNEYQIAHDKIPFYELEMMDIKTLSGKLQRNKGTGEGLIKYMTRIADDLKRDGKRATAANYFKTIDHLKAFTEKEDISFPEANLEFIERFHTWLIKTRMESTATTYITKVKAIFKHAINHDYLRADINPFLKYRIAPIVQTRKMNLKPEEFKALDLAEKTAGQQKAWDLFKASFLLQGVSFVDLLNLTKNNIKNGRVEFKRAKVNTLCSVKIRPELTEIFMKYPGKSHLLDPIEGVSYYLNAITVTNKRLGVIAKKAGIGTLSTYYARHTVAATAKRLGMRKEIISDLLFHSYGSKITDLYTEPDYTAMDNAMDEIIKAVM